MAPGAWPALYRARNPGLRHHGRGKPRPHREHGGPYPGGDRHRIPRRPGGAGPLEAGRRQCGRRAGEIRAGHATRNSEDGAGRIHPACAQSGKVGQHRRQERGVLARLWLTLRHGPRQGPPLWHDRGFPQFREARAVLALAAPFRRNDLRASRRAGQQAPSRHGLYTYPLFGSRLSWAR